MAIRLGNLVHVHMPKTGGTFVYKTMMAQTPKQKVPVLVHGHCFLSDIDSKELKGDLVFGTIRNPWNWYASWYEHAMSIHNPERKLISKIGRGSTEFKNFLYGATHPKEIGLNQSINRLWAVHLREEENGPLSNDGLFSNVAGAFYGDPFQVHALVDCAPGMMGLKELGIEIANAEPANIKEKRERSLPENIQEAYDKEMIDWVWKADKKIIELMWYEPFAPSPFPIFFIGQPSHTNL
jgi:hypothetical protein